MISIAHSLFGRLFKPRRPKRRKRRRQLGRTTERYPTIALLSANPVVESFSQLQGSNVVVEGTVSNDESNVGLFVEFDTNGDEQADDWTVTDSTGKFTFQFPPMFGETIYKVQVSDEFGSSGWIPATISVPAPVVADFRLLNDTGVSNSDSITSDATVVGSIASNVEYAGIPIEFDLDNDGVEDFMTMTDWNGDFQLDGNSVFSFGDVTIQARTSVYSPNGTELTSDWVSLTFVLESPPPAEITNLALVNDTGTSTTDNITTNGTITGVVQDEGSVEGAIVEIDWNGDGLPDDYTMADASGVFTYDTTAHIAPGNVYVQARAVTWNDTSSQYVYGDWQAVSFELELLPAPIITQLALAYDTGTSNSDDVTSDGTITGVVQGEGSLEGIIIEIDWDGDGSPDDYTITDAYGVFTYDTTQHLSPGFVTIKVRALVWDALSNQYVHGNWVSLSFEIEDEMTI